MNRIKKQEKNTGRTSFMTTTAGSTIESIDVTHNINTGGALSENP